MLTDPLLPPLQLILANELNETAGFPAFTSVREVVAVHPEESETVTV